MKKNNKDMVNNRIKVYLDQKRFEERNRIMHYLDTDPQEDEAKEKEDLS